MATSMRRMQVRYAQYEDTEYVLDNTSKQCRLYIMVYKHDR